MLLGVVLGACTNGGALGNGPALDRAGLAGMQTYRVGIGDKVKLTVFGESDLSGTFEVGGTGSISLPLIGEVPAKGQTLEELRKAIVARLSEGYLKNPKINVEMMSYRPIYVHGEVRSGGEFPFKNGLKFRDAIALAGGYTYRAHQGYVMLWREGQTSDVRINLPADIIIMPGDNIRVPERFF